MPSPLERETAWGEQTCFEFPFDNPAKSAQNAFEEIQLGLAELDETTLLFLSNLQSIKWQIGGETTHVLRRSHNTHHLEILREHSGGSRSISHYLRFSKKVEGVEKQCVSIAFELGILPDVETLGPTQPIHTQLKIVPAGFGRVAVYFPAQKETSGLQFHIHAPFVPELSRASVKETPVNGPLFEQLADLAVESLHKIRDLKLLTGEFLGVLPNQSEVLPERYQAIRESITRAMNTQPLTPTYAKGFAPARQLLQAKASLKALLTKEDLSFLVDHIHSEKLEWAVSAPQRHSPQDRFLTGLDIDRWDIDEFINAIATKTDASGWQRPDEDFMVWLANKPDEWLQRLYATLYRELDPEGKLNRLDDASLVRLADGSFSLGVKCYFPTEGEEEDTSLPRVAEGVYSSGKNQTEQNDARRFLDGILVSEVGESDLVEVILNNHYRGDAISPRQNDLRRFIEIFEKQSDCASLFKSYHVFECQDGEWVEPSGIYLDEPLCHTGLAAYYEPLESDEKPRALAEWYQNCGISKERIVQFAIAAGARDQLLPTETVCRDNPDWDYLKSVKGTFPTTPIDRDFVLPGLATAFLKPNLELSRLVWNMMSWLETHEWDCLQAEYRLNQTNGSHYADSQLIHQLKKSAWIPQTDETFAIPTEASSELLPGGFLFDAGNRWLSAIRFGKSAGGKSPEHKATQSMAKTLGIEVEDVELIKDHQEDFEHWIREMQRRKSVKIHLERKVSKNRERRDQKLKERREQAPVKESVVKPRMVAAYSSEEISRQHLYDFYCNEDGEVFCQMCCHFMPFLKRNGDQYIECVSLFTKSWADKSGYALKVMSSLNIVLCPVCSEVYREYMHNDLDKQSMLYEYFNNGADGDFTVCDREVRKDLKLGTLCFDQTHLEDIRVCLSHNTDSSDNSTEN